METRRLITAVLLSFLVWILIQRIFFPKPLQQTVMELPQTTQTALQTQATGSQPVSQAKVIENTVVDDRIVLGDSKKDGGYEMQDIFCSRVAVLSSVQLTRYSESVTEKDKAYNLIKPVKYSWGQRDSLAIEKIVLTGENGEKYTYNLADTKWFYKTEMKSDGMSVRFWIDLLQADEPVLRVVKTYSLAKNTFDLDMDIEFENLSGKKYTLVITQLGPTGIRQEDPRSEDRKTFVGTIRPSDYKGVKSTGILRRALEKEPNFSKRLGAVDEQVVWGGEVNKYFAALLNSVDSKRNLYGDQIELVEAKALDATNKEFGEDMTTVWLTKPLTVESKAKKTLYFELYLGPKSDSVFSRPEYVNRNYESTFDTSWCTLQSLADFMAWLLKGFYLVTRNYGVAIILLVVLVRVCLHPVTKSSQMSMMRMQRDMQKLQPKLAALKTKYKDDREGLNKATMELYKAEGFNPAGQMMGCLPMFIQMPLWVALWTALNNSFELRHQPFFLWIKDLAAPDALVHFAHAYTIPIISAMIGPVHSLNILPLIMVLSMILQQKFSPQSAPADADPAQAKQQKFMFYFMGIFFGLLFYNAPSGLSLYILTSNFIGIFETRRIRRHLEEEAKNPPKAKKATPNWLAKMRDRMEKIAKEYEAEKEKSAKSKGKK